MRPCFRAISSSSGEDLHVPGDDEGRYLAAQQVVEHPAAVLQLHGLEEGHLGLAEHLQALGLEVVVKAHQLQGRAIHIGNAHRALVIVAAPAHDLHIKILHQLAELGGGALHLICHMEAPCSSVYIYSIISYRGRFYNTKNAACRPVRLLCGTRLPAPQAGFRRRRSLPLPILCRIFLFFCQIVLAFSGFICYYIKCL